MSQNYAPRSQNDPNEAEIDRTIQHDIPVEIQRHFANKQQNLRALFFRDLEQASRVSPFRNPKDVIEQTRTWILENTVLPDDDVPTGRVVIGDEQEYVPTPKYSIAETSGEVDKYQPTQRKRQDRFGKRSSHSQAA